MRIHPGRPSPLGATYDGTGTNFSLFSEVAERVELCLFDEAGDETRVDLPEVTGYCWHGYLPGVAPGQRYGYRVHGPWDPAAGHRCNPVKLLLDPYARAFAGELTWNDAVLPYAGLDDLDARNDLDSAPFLPKCVVEHSQFDWGDDRPPQIPEHESVLYEVHVKGFTRRHPGIPEELRGTYAGLAHPAAVAHLKELGVTAVELLPIQQFVHDQFLVDQGLRNYWGYSPIGYFAPHARVRRDPRDSAAAACGSSGRWSKPSTGGHRGDPRRGLQPHRRGRPPGTDALFKGIDNAAYYRLMPDRRLVPGLHRLRQHPEHAATRRRSG